MDSKKPVRNLVCGGLAGAIAEGMTIPVDVVKVRMQLQGETGRGRQYKNAVDACMQIHRHEGAVAFTKGLVPAVLRQLTYGSLRFGLYTRCKESFGASNGVDSALGRKLLAGAVAGGSAAFVCSPSDLIKVRMQADGMHATSTRVQYRGVLHAATSIVRLEGVLGLYKGAMPTSARAAVVSASEIASYDEIKCAFVRSGVIHDGIPLHLVSGALSGFLATLASSPFDVVKSRLMTQPFGSNGVGLRYRGMMHCFITSFRHEGLRFGVKGFWPNFLTKGPSVVLMFLLYEQICKLADRFTAL